MNQTIGPDSCFPNLTAAQVKELQNIKSKALFPVYRLYFAWIPLPLIVVALLLTVLFAFVSYEAIKCRRVSRKCYIFIINRAIGDILSCVFFLLCAIHLLTTDQENFNIHIFIALVILCGGCLWTAMVSYVSLSLIKLYAVYKPLNYRSTFSTKRCMLLIAIGWIVYSLIILYTCSVVIISMFKNVIRSLHISATRSMYIMSRSKDVFFVGVYVITIVVFLLTVIFIRRGRKFVNNLQIGRSHSAKRKFPFWRLSLSVFIFAIVNFAFVYATIMAIFFQDSCYWRVHRDRRAKTIGLLRCVLLIRIIVDGIVGFIIDSQLRRVAINLFHVKILRRMIVTSTVSDSSSESVQRRTLSKGSQPGPRRIQSIT